ncbi:MAG: efflux RND transporter permease subunit [Dysgonamonadaceae bacterium]|jgi:multidrug efflux pump subunit AcrB|nr:efflux RND transporter permease subunit [Dysgonamonadaceae bacterium]
MKISSFTIILGFVCLSLVGLALMHLLPVKLSPSQTLPQIGVSFSLPGSASRVVEMEVTSKLEAMLSRIKGIEKIGSTSGNGRGNINIRFDKHVNIDAARFEVSTVIRQIWPNLPQNMPYPTISLARSDENANSAFLSYTINSPANPIVIQQYAENNIKPVLAQIAGVNRINVSGAMPMEWRLEYDYKQLESLGLSVQDMLSAINHYMRKEFFGTASIENQSGEKQWIRLALVPKENGDEKFNPAKIEVKNSAGRLIPLDKLITISHAEQEAQSYYRINGLNSIYLTISSDDNANQLELSRKIKDRIDKIQAQFPAGYEMHISYDATEFIQSELEKVYFRSGMTLMILLVFVLIIYRNLKYLLLIFLSLFMNIAVAIIFYYLENLEIQLYSLAGITISLTLILDNTIVMSDQILHRHNKKAFLAILTATLTTIASLVIIFFMDERIRLNLQDFAMVLIINLMVSLFIALFLVPALIEKLKMEKREKPKKRKKLFLVYFNRFYTAFCRFTWRWRVPVCVLIVLLFGLPVFLLPDKIDKEGKWAEFYNKTIGSTLYKEKIKPHSDAWLGGTLRLFSQKVYNGSYWGSRGEQTEIYVSATLPNGSTLSQMNNLVQKMEQYISQFPEVKQFQTRIQSARRASINILFTKESERTGFPYQLKSNLITKALELGGGSWMVSGLGDGFSNDVRETAGQYSVILHGFNYDELSELSEKFKQILLTYRRIKDVVIGSEFSYYKDDYREFLFSLNHEHLAQGNIQPVALFNTLRPTFGQDIQAGTLPGEYGLERIVLHSKQSMEYDIWSLDNVPGRTTLGKEYKLKELAALTKEQAPQSIVKENQQYQLLLQYEYIGAYEQGKKVLERNIEAFQKELPLGYTIENGQENRNWGKNEAKQYGLLLVIFVIIFLTCSVLFNSLKQPFAVIFVIPISFIGIFLAFYLFRLNFDQGGFASFILLCGLSVNANIYILNEYNNILKKRNILPLKAYIKAWNAKISPIFLTVISTILGFIPFMIGAYKESFWYPLAAGTIGGLAVSLFGTFCFLPLFMGVGKKLIAPAVR